MFEIHNSVMWESKHQKRSCSLLSCTASDNGAAKRQALHARSFDSSAGAVPTGTVHTISALSAFVQADDQLDIYGAFKASGLMS